MKLRRVILSTICLSLVLAGCSSQTKYSSYAQTEDLLKVGVVGAFVDNEAYKKIYEPVIKKCAKAVYGSEDRYTIIKTNSATQTYSIDSSDVDISLLLIPKTDTLASSYSLSDAYYTDQMVVISKTADMKFSDLNGKHIGILNDTAQKTIYNNAVKNANLNIDTDYFVSYPDMIDFLANDKIAAIVGPKLQLQAYIKDGQNIGESFADIQYCIAASTSKSKWITAINKALKE